MKDFKILVWPEIFDESKKWLQENTCLKADYLKPKNWRDGNSDPIYLIYGISNPRRTICWNYVTSDKTDLTMFNDKTRAQLKAAYPKFDIRDYKNKTFYCRASYNDLKNNTSLKTHWLNNSDYVGVDEKHIYFVDLHTNWYGLAQCDAGITIFDFEDVKDQLKAAYPKFDPHKKGVIYCRAKSSDFEENTRLKLVEGHQPSKTRTLHGVDLDDEDFWPISWVSSDSVIYEFGDIKDSLMQEFPKPKGEVKSELVECTISFDPCIYNESYFKVGQCITKPLTSFEIKTKEESKLEKNLRKQVKDAETALTKRNKEIGDLKNQVKDFKRKWLGTQDPFQNAVYRFKHYLDLAFSNKTPANINQAFLMSLAKWHPSRGEKQGHHPEHMSEVSACGLCRFKNSGPTNPDDNCYFCPIAESHLCDGVFQSWKKSNKRPNPTEKQKQETKKLADRMFYGILKAYLKEIENKEVEKGEKPKKPKFQLGEMVVTLDGYIGRIINIERSNEAITYTLAGCTFNGMSTYVEESLNAYNPGEGEKPNRKVHELKNEKYLSTFTPGTHIEDLDGNLWVVVNKDFHGWEPMEIVMKRIKKEGK
jgi:hypothetical protein